MRPFSSILTSSSSSQLADKPLPIEAFVISHLDTPKKELNNSIVRKQSLSWSSPYYHKCSNSEPGSVTGQSVTIRCPDTYTGRWLAVRSKSTLNICLVSVYIERGKFKDRSNDSDKMIDCEFFKFQIDRLFSSHSLHPHLGFIVILWCNVSEIFIIQIENMWTTDKTALINLA